MARRCPNCKEIMCLSSLTDKDGINYLKCSNCNALLRFRPLEEDKFNKFVNYRHPKTALASCKL